MTMQPPPPVAAITPKGWATWFLQCSPQDKETIITDHAKKTVEMFIQLRELLREAVAGGNDPPAERLAQHIRRPTPRWEMFRQLLPKEYDEQQKDFHQLVQRYESDPDFRAQVDALMPPQQPNNDATIASPAAGPLQPSQVPPQGVPQP